MSDADHMAEALEGAGSCCSHPVNYTRPRGSRTQSDRRHLQTPPQLPHSALILFCLFLLLLFLLVFSFLFFFFLFLNLVVSLLSILRNAHYYFMFYSKNIVANNNFTTFVEKCFFVTAVLKVRIAEGPPLCFFLRLFICLFVCLAHATSQCANVPSIIVLYGLW